MIEAFGSSAAPEVVILVLIRMLPAVLFARRSRSPSGSSAYRRLDPLCAVSFMASLLIQTVWLELIHR